MFQVGKELNLMINVYWDPLPCESLDVYTEVALPKLLLG